MYFFLYSSYLYDNFIDEIDTSAFVGLHSLEYLYVTMLALYQAALSGH